MKNLRTSRPIGRCVWAVAEGYLPEWSRLEDRRLVSHESFCVLNACDEIANVEITLLFTDREPVGPYRLQVLGRRTKHIRLNDLTDPEPVPRGTEFSSVIESNVPIVVQHTRLDARDPNISIMTTLAYSES